jgi:pilus assembly protein CpaC
MSTECGGRKSGRGGTRQVSNESGNLFAVLVVCCAFLGAPPSAATEVLPATNSQVINLMVGQGRLLRFDGPADSVFIADSSLADLRVVSPDVVYVYGKKSGTTNLIAVSKDLSVRSTAEFRVATDPRPANDTRQTLQPTSTVDISIFGTRAAATGRTRRIEEATDVENVVETYTPPGQPPINNTTIADTQQVNIRVRFAEVSHNDLESLGFDWKVFATLGNFGTGGKVDIDVLIKALQERGVLTILAEPNLTAVTGQSASFLAGGEIPIPVPQTTGLMTVQYKPFGVSLEFTPTIIKTNRIALRVRPEVSALSRAGSIKMSGVELPSLTVRRADTTVEVASGQTFAIAGLFERQLSDDLSQVAGLGDIPVLGELFRSTKYRRDETELVILITPYLVKPARDRAVATPLDHPTPPPPLPRRRPEAQQLGYSVK